MRWLIIAIVFWLAICTAQWTTGIFGDRYVPEYVDNRVKGE